MTSTDDRYRSRKFIVAVTSLVASVYALVYGLSICVTAQDVAIVVGAWGLTDAAILKLYNDANLAGDK